MPARLKKGSERSKKCSKSKCVRLYRDSNQILYAKDEIGWFVIARSGVTPGFVRILVRKKSCLTIMVAEHFGFWRDWASGQPWACCTHLRLEKRPDGRFARLPSRAAML